MTNARNSLIRQKEAKHYIHSVISADEAERAVTALKDGGRIQSEKTRERLARNLGKILEDRKKTIKSLSELVANAGISANPDSARLGRFRIRPEKTPSPNTLKRLSEGPF